MDQPDIEQVARQLAQEAPARKKERKQWSALCIGSAALTGACAFLYAATMDNSWAVVSRLLALTSLLLTAVTISVIRRQQKDRRLLQIAALEDTRMVGALLDILESAQEMWEYDDPWRRTIKATLIRLLPRLQASDAEWLTEKQRASIARTLYYCTHAKYPWHFNADLAVASLKALEQVGDSQALPYVEELASASFKRAEDQRRIREAAQECLPFLHERASKRQAFQTLLRASQETVDPKVLLRPMGAHEIRIPREPSDSDGA